MLDVSFLLTLVATMSTADPTETDLLTLGSGAIIITAPPKAERAALVALDGDPRTVSIGEPATEPLPLEFVVELPAETTFTRFEIPEASTTGTVRGRHIATVRVEGSSVSPHKDFELLVEARLDPDSAGRQRFTVTKALAARWVRVTFVDRLAAPRRGNDPHHFSELEGYGTQAPIANGTARFAGRWRYRKLGVNDMPSGDVIAITQRGSEVIGCERREGRVARVTGHVEGGLAWMLSEDAEGKRRPFTAVIADTGELAGVAFDGAAQPYYAAPDPTLRSPCTEEPSANPIADDLGKGRNAVLFGVHFDVDTDALLPEAKPALEQILRALKQHPELRVSIVGHMDAAGAASFLLDLSERRAQVVASWLTDRGVDVRRLEPVGRGGAEPIADNATSAGRALNQRIEIAPIAATR